jgi:acyl carrier protein
VIPAEPMETELMETLWQSLRGGDYNLEEIRQNIHSNSRFEDFGIDSLDMTDFFLRIEEQYGVKIPQAEYPNLESIARIRAFLEGKLRTEPAT